MQGNVAYLMKGASPRGKASKPNSGTGVVEASPRSYIWLCMGSQGTTNVRSEQSLRGLAKGGNTHTLYRDPEAIRAGIQGRERGTRCGKRNWKNVSACYSIVTALACPELHEGNTILPRLRCHHDCPIVPQ